MVLLFFLKIKLNTVVEREMLIWGCWGCIPDSSALRMLCSEKASWFLRKALLEVSYNGV